MLPMDEAKNTKEVAISENKVGALKQLPCFEISVDDENSANNTIMDHSDERQSLDPMIVDGEVEPNELVNSDEKNIKPDQEQVKQATVAGSEHTAGDTTKSKSGQPFQRTTAPDSEHTAENGWIVIFQTPKVPYDQHADPAGLYGGREVDDRPSLLEFYHQDARTNGNFARMAPTKMELEVKAAQSKLAKARQEEAQLAASKLQDVPATSQENPTGKQTLKLRPPKGGMPPPPRPSCANVLTEVSRASAPSNNTSVLSRRPANNVSFTPETKQGSSRAKVMTDPAKTPIADKVKSNDNVDFDYGEIMDIDLDEQHTRTNAEWVDGGSLYRTKSVRTWQREASEKGKWCLEVTNPDFHEYSDDEEALALPSVERDEEDDLKKAIAASLAQHERDIGEKRAAELKENIDPDMQKTLDASVALEIKANTDFHDQLMEVDNSVAAMEREKAEEEADLALAIWQSLEGSPDKKRKISSQSLPENGASEVTERGEEERGWVTPKVGEKVSHKRLSSPAKKSAGV